MTSPADSVPSHLATAEPATRRPKRTVLLHLHLSEAAVTGWVEEGRNPVTADTIRDWCGRPGVQVVVKPVIDLNTDIAVDGYEIPDRIRDHVTLRDRTCVFPYCTRPARTADIDHIESYDPHGPPGQTATDKVAPKCRTHHRLKTHDHRGHGWTYTPPRTRRVPLALTHRTHLPPQRRRHHHRHHPTPTPRLTLPRTPPIGGAAGVPG